MSGDRGDDFENEAQARLSGEQVILSALRHQVVVYDEAPLLVTPDCSIVFRERPAAHG